MGSASSIRLVYTHSFMSRRLQKELTDLHTNGTPVGEYPLYHTLPDCSRGVRICTGITLLRADDFQAWFLSIEVLGDTVYQVCPWKMNQSIRPLTLLQGEVFALRFRFDSTYPIVAPSVTFVVDEQYTAPVHPVRHSIFVAQYKPNYRSAACLLQRTRT